MINPFKLKNIHFPTSPPPSLALNLSPTIFNSCKIPVSGQILTNSMSINSGIALSQEYSRVFKPSYIYERPATLANTIREKKSLPHP
jgi:hypothetical protein